MSTSLNFNASSGNVGRLTQLENDAFRVTWLWEFSPKDMEEVESWFADAMNANITRSIGIDNEAANIQKWKASK